jgi:hypothetical protein
MTDTAAEKRASMLDKVRKLLAKANDPAVGEAEAEAFRAAADNLMTKYSIEQWEAQTAENQSARPEVRKVNIDWWYDTRDRDSAHAIFAMFAQVYRHCRCVVGYRGQDYCNMPVIGLASDLDWADQLFTSLLLQLNRNLIVRPDASKSLAENVYAMRMAGMGWMYITESLWKAGLVEPPRKPVKTGRWTWVEAETSEHSLTPGREYREVTETVTAETDWKDIGGTAREVIKNRLAQTNRAYAREHNLARNYVKPEVYQRSFTEGFCSEVRHRLYKMSSEYRYSYDAEHGSGSMDLVVQDIYTQAVVLYDATFPPPPPVKPNPNAKPRKMAMVREKARSGSALRAGEREGARANLSNNPTDRLRPNSPELPR